MKKRIIIVLVVVSMALFGSVAFAGDDWQDGFAKALDQNNLAGALTLAYNSQASPQAVHEALEAFGVEQEEVGESFMLAVEYKDCDWWCQVFKTKCLPASSSEPTAPICQSICDTCKCDGC